MAPLWHSDSASDAGDALQLALNTHRRRGHGLLPKAATSPEIWLVRNGHKLARWHTSIWF